jgi:chromosome segregation ATPase
VHELLMNSEINSTLVTKTNASRTKIALAKSESKECTARIEEERCKYAELQDKYVKALKEANRERKVLLAAMLDLEAHFISAEHGNAAAPEQHNLILKDIGGIKEYLTTSCKRHSVDVSALKKNIENGSIPSGRAGSLLDERSLSFQSAAPATSSQTVSTNYYTSTTQESTSSSPHHTEMFMRDQSSRTFSSYTGSDDLARCHQRILNLENQLSTLQHDFVGSMQQNHHLQKEIDTQLHNSEHTIKLLRSEIEAGKAREGALNLEKEKLTGDLRHQRSEYLELQASFEQAQQSFFAQAAHTKQLEQAHSLLQERASKSEHSCLEFVEIVNELQKRLKDAEQTLESQKSSSKAVLAQLARDNKDQTEAMAFMQQQYDETCRQLAIARDRGNKHNSSNPAVPTNRHPRWLISSAGSSAPATSLSPPSLMPAPTVAQTSNCRRARVSNSSTSPS